MLRDATAEFPQNGAEAFVVGSIEAVTIIRRNDDGTALLKRTGPTWGGFRGASGNITLPLSQLRATPKEANEAGANPRRSRGTPAKPRNRRSRRLPKGKR